MKNDQVGLYAQRIHPVFAILFFTNAVPYVQSDGYCYYHIAKSLIDYGSFVSPERPEYYDYKGHVLTQFNGNYVTVCSPGDALLNYPGLLIANKLKTDQTIYSDYFMALHGHTLAEGLSFIFTATLFAFGTLILLYKLFRELYLPEKTSSITNRRRISFRFCSLVRAAGTRVYAYLRIVLHVSFYADACHA